MKGARVLVEVARARDREHVLSVERIARDRRRANVGLQPRRGERRRRRRATRRPGADLNAGRKNVLEGPARNLLRLSGAEPRHPNGEPVAPDRDRAGRGVRALDPDAGVAITTDRSALGDLDRTRRAGRDQLSVPSGKRRPGACSCTSRRGSEGRGRRRMRQGPRGAGLECVEARALLSRGCGVAAPDYRNRRIYVKRSASKLGHLAGQWVDFQPKRIPATLPAELSAIVPVVRTVPIDDRVELPPRFAASHPAPLVAPLDERLQ
jgi:hypothetical protein